jgi:hypothetical protein
LALDVLDNVFGFEQCLSDHQIKQEVISDSEESTTGDHEGSKEDQDGASS